jgi:hypothetical protein
MWKNNYFQFSVERYSIPCFADISMISRFDKGLRWRNRQSLCFHAALKSRVPFSFRTPHIRVKRARQCSTKGCRFSPGTPVNPSTVAVLRDQSPVVRWMPEAPLESIRFDEVELRPSFVIHFSSQLQGWLAHPHRPRGGCYQVLLMHSSILHGIYEKCFKFVYCSL